MRIFSKTSRYIIGLIILPLLYIRYSFILFIPLLLLSEIPTNNIYVLWFLYVLLFGFLMGNCGLLSSWSKLFVSILDIKYEINKIVFKHVFVPLFSFM